MSRYTADSRDRVLDAVEMLSLVSARTELQRKGVNSYFGLCPFHSERTPSFHVRPDEKHYHCFGCQASGDPFTFVMETEGLDFKGALEALADRFGVKLERESEDPAAAARRARRERLYTLLGRACAYYARYLWEAQEAQAAREYLRSRGITEETLKEFRVGYAPRSWDRLASVSRAAGFSDEELLAAGLAQRPRGRQDRLIDRFRGRIMFPSADARGRVLGFGARTMDESEQPKYLNSSESDLYHKRSQLFGIDLARSEASRSGRVVLVEGYTDVLALHQAGLRNAVGIMGTSLTEEQVTALERVAKVLELCLDADAAGQQAMLRAAGIVAGRSLELRVVALPPGTDPAELVEQEGAEGLRERVRASVPFEVFHVERILERADVHSAEGRDRALEELRPVLATVPPSAMREELSRRIAGRLELTPGRLATLAAARAPAAGGAREQTPRRTASLDPWVRSERDFLALCVALPEAGRRALAAIDPEQHITSARLRRAARHLAGQVEMPMAGLDADDEELARVVSALVRKAATIEDVTEQRLEHARLLLELERLERAITRARGEGGVAVSLGSTGPAGAAGPGGERAAPGGPRIQNLARERQAVIQAIHDVGRVLEGAV